MGDLNEDDFNRLVVEVGKKVREATGLSVEESEAAACSVAGCCIETDEEGRAILRDPEGVEVTRLPWVVIEQIQEAI